MIIYPKELQLEGILLQKDKDIPYSSVSEYLKEENDKIILVIREISHGRKILDGILNSNDVYNLGGIRHQIKEVWSISKDQYIKILEGVLDGEYVLSGKEGSSDPHRGNKPAQGLTEKEVYKIKRIIEELNK